MYIIKQGPQPPTSPWSVRTQEEQQEVSSKASSTAPQGLNYCLNHSPIQKVGQLLQSIGSPRVGNHSLDSDL